MHTNTTGPRVGSCTVPRFVRPTRILMRWQDPFDGRVLCSSDEPYNPRVAANGGYTRSIGNRRSGFKHLFSDILEGRNPKLKLAFLYGRSNPTGHAPARSAAEGL